MKLNNFLNMFENHNYYKKFNIKSVRNTYTITLGSIERNNEKILYIKLVHQYPNKNNIYYTEKSLKEIHKENKYLEKYKLINDLIDYLSELIKDDGIGINKNDPNIYKLNFIDKINDKYLFFPLEIEKEINEIEDKNLEIQKYLYELSQQSKIKKMEKKIEMLQSEIENLKKINNENQSSTDDISLRSIEKNKPFGYENKKNINNNNEKCEIFIAFHLPNDHPIIAWIIRNSKNVINIKNLHNNLTSSTMAHTTLINNLQYFHNENLNEKNDYIISFSENDEKTFKIWLLLNEIDLKMNVIMTVGFLKISIEQFCVFNNKYYSNENSFLFLFGKSTKQSNQDINKGINCYKFDNKLNLKKWEDNYNNNNNIIKIINNYEKINYLNTFYYLKEKKLYLITCSDDNLNVIENPFYENTKIFFNHNNDKYHLRAFMIERNDILELFDSNLNGIFVWTINNNKIPQLKLHIDINNSIPYDICLWNNDYLWASTSSGFFFIKINENKQILKVEESLYKPYSKVNIISDPKEGKSIIGLDNDDILSSWHIIEKE